MANRTFLHHFVVSRILVLLLLWYNCFPNSSKALDARSGRSSISMFQGSTKYEFDGKECPVGIAFQQPEYFSCACINGIWAFYDNPCHSPIAIIGGDNHCFQMPAQPITMAIIVSNPLRALGESLTSFEGDMDGVRSKIYRKLHLNLTNADKFVSLNSSWTLISPDESKSICIENQNVVFEDLTNAEIDMLPGLSYCSFVDVNQEMPYIGSVRPGCNSSMILEPLECQPVLPTTDEQSVCYDERIIATYYEQSNERKANSENSEVESIDPIVANEEQEFMSIDNPRLTRALESLGKFTADPTTPPPVEKPTEPPPKFASAYYGEPEWHQRWAVGKGPDYFQQKQDAPPPSSTDKHNEVDVEQFWENPKLFFTVSPGKTASSMIENPLMTTHLWMYQRYAIRNVLNITRLVPPEEDMIVRVTTGRIKKLLRMHSEIIKKICPLAPKSYYNTVIGTFMSVLTKGFRWKEPYLEQTHYLQMLTALTTCKNRAHMMTFVAADPKQCQIKGASYITLPDKDLASTVNVRLEIPEVFQSEKFEPIIESVWKVFVAVHSYCYKDFSDQYQDHHRYTTLMMGLFSNRLHDIWARNKTLDVEYSGILGNLVETLKNLDSCAMGARMSSEYPYHLNRPTKMAKYHEDEIDSNSRRKRNVGSNDIPNNKVSESKGPNPFSENENVAHIRKKRVAVHVVNTDDATNKYIFDGKGICLRRYSESRLTVGKHCKE